MARAAFKSRVLNRVHVNQVSRCTSNVSNDKEKDNGFYLKEKEKLKEKHRQKKKNENEKYEDGHSYQGDYYSQYKDRSDSPVSDALKISIPSSSSSESSSSRTTPSNNFIHKQKYKNKV